MKDAHILIVEDDPISKSGLVQILHGYGYANVSWVTKGIDAITFINDNTVDLIFMDISLGGKLDGIESAQLINNSIPIIFISSSTDCETFERIAKTQSFGFLQKPLTPKLVNTALENALN